MCSGFNSDEEFKSIMVMVEMVMLRRKYEENDRTLCSYQIPLLTLQSFISSILSINSSSHIWQGWCGTLCLVVDTIATVSSKVTTTTPTVQEDEE